MSRCHSFQEASQSQGGKNQYGKQFSLPLKGGKPDIWVLCDTAMEEDGEMRFPLKSTCVELQTVSFAILDLYDLWHNDPEISHFAVKQCSFLQPKHHHLLKTFPCPTIPWNLKPKETASHCVALKKKRSGHWNLWAELPFGFFFWFFFFWCLLVFNISALPRHKLHLDLAIISWELSFQSLTRGHVSKHDMAFSFEFHSPLFYLRRLIFIFLKMRNENCSEAWGTQRATNLLWTPNPMPSIPFLISLFRGIFLQLTSTSFPRGGGRKQSLRFAFVCLK